MEANVCQYCGHDYRIQAGPPAKKKTALPLVGGIMILVGGVIALLAGIGLMGTGGAFDAFMIIDVQGVNMFEDILTACGVIFIILGLVAVLGGIFALMRKHFGLAILGGVFALIAGLFIPGLIGLILVGMSKDEFE